MAKPKRKLLDGLTDERGGAALETGLLLALSAGLVVIVKHFMASPMLVYLNRAARIIGQALG